ncbi:hypothetical protein HAX54_052599, partial [Datura stramonium]|nr:hypothetical protein [Datura stramonium]
MISEDLKVLQPPEPPVAPNQATYYKSRGNVAKVKVEIDMLKHRLDQIWLGYKRMDGTDDGKWLDIEYDKQAEVVQKIQEPGKDEVAMWKEQSRKGIIIKEPVDNSKSKKILEVLGKGKEKIHEAAHKYYMIQNEQYNMEKNANKKRRKRNRNRNTRVNSEIEQGNNVKQTTEAENGQTSGIKKDPNLNSNIQDKTQSKQWNTTNIMAVDSQNIRQQNYNREEIIKQEDKKVQDKNPDHPIDT